jgi:hypothetical protein
LFLAEFENPRIQGNSEVGPPPADYFLPLTTPTMSDSFFWRNFAQKRGACDSTKALFFWEGKMALYRHIMKNFF